jgi:hypothetical protein
MATNSNEKEEGLNPDFGNSTHNFVKQGRLKQSNPHDRGELKSGSQVSSNLC